MRGHVAVLLLALTALAGCSGGGAGKQGLRLADGSTLELDGEGTSDTLGAIAGVVVDEAVRPVVGALVATLDGRSASTDEGGVFRLGSLEPGFYALSISAAGYLAVQASADVVAGQTATVKAQLPIDFRPQPYLQTYPYEAFMQEWVSIAQFFVEDLADQFLDDTTLCDCSYSFTPDPNVTAIVFEAFWDPVAPDPAELGEYYWEVYGSGDLDEYGYCYSPCRIDVDVGDLAPGETITVRFTGPDFWVAYQQKVSLYTTVFHNGPAPAGWSIASS